jgi:hypothetical protein
MSGIFSSRKFLPGHFLHWQLASGVVRNLELPP